MSHTLLIEIDPDQASLLIDQGFVLCLGKAAPVSAGNSASPNMVWYGTKKFAIYNRFQWTDQFKVFGTRFFRPGALINQQTQFEAIRFGQTCTIDHVGNMSLATIDTQPTMGEFKLKNEYTRPMNAGVTCTLGLQGDPDLPFYVSGSQILKGGTEYLTPLDQITVWFQEDIQTSQMIEEIPGPSFMIDFTGDNSKNQTVSFNQAGDWQAGPLSNEKLPKEHLEGSAGH